MLADLVPIYPLYALLFADTGLSDAEISVLFALWSAVGIVAEVPSGALADRVGRRTSLVIGALVQAVGYACWVVFPGFPGFAAGFVLWGLGSASRRARRRRCCTTGWPRWAPRSTTPGSRAGWARPGWPCRCRRPGSRPCCSSSAAMRRPGGRASLRASARPLLAARLPGRRQAAAAPAIASLVESAPGTPADDSAAVPHGSPRTVVPGDTARGRRGGRRPAAAPAGGARLRPALRPRRVRGVLPARRPRPADLDRGGAHGAAGHPARRCTGRRAGWSGEPARRRSARGRARRRRRAARGSRRRSRIRWRSRGVALFYGLYRAVLVVADARLQERITGPARATVTSVANVVAELPSFAVYAAWAVGGTAAMTVLVAAGGGAAAGAAAPADSH